MRHDGVDRATGGALRPESNLRAARPIFLVISLLLLAGQSSATTYFGEIFTSDIAGDVHAEIVAGVDYNPFDVTVYDAQISSPGLGSALIPPSKSISFGVDPSLGTIEKAWLYIGLTDDLQPFYDPLDVFGMMTEVAVIEFNGIVWSGEIGPLDFLMNPFIGDITTQLLIDQENFVVNISADPTVGGDFQIVAAALKVAFAGEITNPHAPTPTPEPHAALLFAVGTIVVGAVSRRR
jgi:hypothetical protein